MANRSLFLGWIAAAIVLALILAGDVPAEDPSPSVDTSDLLTLKSRFGAEEAVEGSLESIFKHAFGGPEFKRREILAFEENRFFILAVGRGWQDAAAVARLDVPLAVGDHNHGGGVVDSGGDGYLAQDGPGFHRDAVVAEQSVRQNHRASHRLGVDAVLVGDFQVVPATDAHGVADEGLPSHGLHGVGDFPQKDGAHDTVRALGSQMGLDGDVVTLGDGAGEVQFLNQTLQPCQLAGAVVPARGAGGREIHLVAHDLSPLDSVC